MKKYLKICFLIFVCAFSDKLIAQPTDAQIKADLTSPGVTKIELSKTNGAKVWSSTYQQYYWERGAVITRNAKLAEYPNATIEIGGIARYTIVNGKFSYNRFLTTWNEYKGIPTPTDEDVLEMVKQNLSSFLVGRYNDIVSELENLRIAEEKNSEWHTANSFSINLACSYEKKISYTETARYDAIYRVRFYRDAISSPWKPGFVSSNVSETELSKTTHNADDLRVMPTLASIDEEKKANEALAGLPNVEIPQFQSDVEAFLYIHKILREGTADEFEAMMMKMLAPAYFIEGSKVLLNRNGADMINNNRRIAFEGKSTYSQQYCEDPLIKHRQTNMIEFLNKSKQTYTRISIDKFGGRYERGVKVDQEYKIVSLSVGVLTRQEDLDYMNSFPDDELCKQN
ncbi:MAG: hypothetical protein R3D00_14395 [Bacteroidia bacterium]